MFGKIQPITKKDQLLSKPVFELGYRPELDGFRGISILLVFIHHLYIPLMPGGFLITSLLLEEWQRNNSISLKDFYIRRFLRLMPAVFLIVSILAIYAFFFLDKERADKTYQGIWLTLSYISNWLYAFGVVSPINPLGVTWSLAVEEQFYLLYPMLLILLLKLKLNRRQTIFVFVLLIVSVALYRKMLFEHDSLIRRLYYASDTRADGLIIGCLTAFLFSWGLLAHKKFEIYLKIGAVIGFLFLWYMVATTSDSDIFLYESGGFTLVAVSVALILIVLLVHQPKILVMALRFPPLVWLGRVSYGLYLWHWTFRYMVYDKQTSLPSGLDLALAVILSFALTVFSFYLVEKPFLRLKKRFSHGYHPISIPNKTNPNEDAAKG